MNEWSIDQDIINFIAYNQCQYSICVNIKNYDFDEIMTF